MQGYGTMLRQFLRQLHDQCRNHGITIDPQLQATIYEAIKTSTIPDAYVQAIISAVLDAIRVPAIMLIGAYT